MHRRCYVDELAKLPLVEHAERMRDPDVKRRVLADIDAKTLGAGSMASMANAFRVGAPILYMMGENYDDEPTPDMTLGARAEREGNLLKRSTTTI